MNPRIDTEKEWRDAQKRNDPKKYCQNAVTNHFGNFMDESDASP
jgi:hypothetical protein